MTLPVGIVIPTLDEAAALPGLLEDLAALDVPFDLVIADGGSRDGTVAVAERAGARVIRAPAGRGAQLRAGAAAVRGEWLCLLHADVRVPPDARHDLAATLADGTCAAAAWRLRIDAPGWRYRALEWGAARRARLLGLVYGDQGLLVRRELYEAVGGVPDSPVMEDVALVRALRRRTPVRLLPSAIVVSARRWRREGPVRAWMRNVALIAAFLAGVTPARLARWYRPEPPTGGR